MTEQVKFVISKLNEPPFEKKFNLISFDALRPEQLLQVLFDTLAYVDPKAKSDLRNEDAEQLSIKVGLVSALGASSWFSSFRCIKRKNMEAADRHKQGI